MKSASDSLPEDVESLRAFALQMMAERNAVIAERNEAVAERDAAMAAAQHKDEINAQLRQLLRQAMGIEPKSERLSRLDRDQLQLALEDLEQASARDEAQEGKREPARAGLSRISCMGGIIGKKEMCDAPEKRAQYSQCVAG